MANYKEERFATPREILMYPDEYQGRAHTFMSSDSTAVNGIIRAGTIWPSNDANAQGVVFRDVDVSEGPATGVLLFEATLKTNRLPQAPASAAITALPRITFFGAALTSQSAVTVSGLTAPAKGGTPVAVSALSLSAGNGTVKELTWEPVVDSTFAAATQYKARLVIDAANAYKFADTVTVTVANSSSVATTVAPDRRSITSVVTFPATAS